MSKDKIFREAETGSGSGVGFDEVLVRVSDLKMHFPITEGIVINRTVATVKAVDGISFDIKKGETLGLVGESGCGKTTTGRCILQLENQTDGSIQFEGRELKDLDRNEMAKVREKIQVIFQDPYSSLNPRMKVGEIIAEPIAVHKIIEDEGEREARVRELLSICGLR